MKQLNSDVSHIWDKFFLFDMEEEETPSARSYELGQTDLVAMVNARGEIPEWMLTAEHRQDMREERLAQLRKGLEEELLRKEVRKDLGDGRWTRLPIHLAFNPKQRKLIAFGKKEAFEIEDDKRRLDRLLHKEEKVRPENRGEMWADVVRAYGDRASYEALASWFRSMERDYRKKDISFSWWTSIGYAITSRIMGMILGGWRKNRVRSKVLSYRLKVWAKLRREFRKRYREHCDLVLEAGERIQGSYELPMEDLIDQVRRVRRFAEANNCSCEKAIMMMVEQDLL